VPLAASLALAGCVSAAPRAQPGQELVNRWVRVQPASGAASTLHFRSDGTVAAAFGRQQVTGRWQVLGRDLCFFWKGAPRECWPYRTAFQRGVARSVVSDRGNRLRATLQ
jgi:hypothetical protein